MVQRAAEIDYTPNSWLITPLHDVWNRYPNFSNPIPPDDQSPLSFIVGTNQWAKEVAYPPDEYYGSASDFVNNFTAFAGHLPEDYEVYGAAIPIIIYEAIKQACSVDPVEVGYALSRMDFEFFFGRIFYSGNHMLLSDTVTIQYPANYQKGGIRNVV